VAEPSKELIRVVEDSALPTLLLRVPSEEIVAASEEAGRLLGVAPAALVGRNVEEFAADQPSGGLVLVAQGRVSGFQASRTMRRGDGVKQSLQVWVRATDRDVPIGCVVAILWPGGRAPWMYLPSRDEDAPDPQQIIGTVDAHLVVERVSDDVRMLCRTPDEVIGASIFTLFDVSSAADVLHALASATESGRGLCLMVNVCLEDGPGMAELVVRPLAPAPSFSFCILVHEGGPPIAASEDEQRRFDALGQSLHALALAETMAQYADVHLKGSDKLTSREMDIIARLLDGDRVPAIARDLYLSQSTIRNHLSSAFRKLGVSSQQELVDLFKETAQRLRSQDTSSS